MKKRFEKSIFDFVTMQFRAKYLGMDLLKFIKKFPSIEEFVSNLFQNIFGPTL